MNSNDTKLRELATKNANLNRHLTDARKERDDLREFIIKVKDAQLGKYSEEAAKLLSKTLEQ